MMVNSIESKSLAFKARHDLTGGFVLFWKGEAYCWKDRLRDPQTERPGAIAVDDFGNVYKAEGGNDYDGAKNWLKIG